MTHEPNDAPQTRPSDPTPAERVRALAPLLSDGDPRVRKSAVVALGRLRDAASTEALARCLDDPDEGVRVLACQALGRLGDPSSCEALLAHVHDPSVEVRSGVLWGIANLAAHGDLAPEARAALFTPVMVLAFDPDDGVRADAAAVVGALRDERATDALGVLLDDACARVRGNACASLGLTDDEAGLELLLDVSENLEEDPLVLVSALDGLARRAGRASMGPDSLRARRAVRAACALASDEVAVGKTSDGEGAPDGCDVRATALWALGALGALAPQERELVQGVLQAALDPSGGWACRYAIGSLAGLHDELAHAALRTCADAWFADGAPALDEEVARVLNEALGTFA